MIYKNSEYMTGRDEGNYKGYEFKLNGYGGFQIKGILSFQPYAHNRLFDNDTKTIRQKLLAKIRYIVNRELKGGNN